MSALTPGSWLVDREYGDAGGHGIVIRNEAYDYAVDEFGVTSEANASLIAAAPDLLAALCNLDSLWCESESQGVDFYYAIQQARAAIAKAKGELP